ncbi:MAG: hypothetical protein ABJB40_08920, partial [Acidobacteriota bacterium]
MRSKSLILLVLSSFLLALPLRAQEPVDAVANAKIRDEGLNRSQVYKTFTHFTEVIGPRLTGSSAVKAADDYSLGLLKVWGLSDPHLEAWDFGRGWTLEKSSVEMIEPRYMPLIGYPEAWSASTAGEMVATPVFIGNKTVADLEKMKGQLKGAIVLSQPIQDSYERTDRQQPTMFDTPVA